MVSDEKHETVMRRMFDRSGFMRKPTMPGIILVVVCASAGACIPLDLSGDLEVSLNGEWCFMLNGPKKEQEVDYAYRSARSRYKAGFARGSYRLCC
jgi:hypothetical protein